jgi:hypothetical protein
MNLRTRTIYDGDTVVETIQKEITWSILRDERDRELDRTDWRAVKDRTMSQAWKDYRAFLRELPQNFESANDAADAWAAYTLPE